MGTAQSFLQNIEAQFVIQLDRLGAQFNEKLSPQSIMFLHTLWKKAPVPFDLLLNKIRSLSLRLEARHIDKVVESLYKQMNLPEMILLSLHSYISMDCDYEAIINALFAQRAPELLSYAQTHHLLHHSLPHALETATRANKVFDNLNIITHEDVGSLFLRKLATFMIQFHDHEPQDKGDMGTAKELTAIRVSGWLTSALSLEKSSLALLIDFMVDRIIVLGTTMIDSGKRTMDLAELFFEVKKVAVFAGFTGLSYELPLDASSVMESKSQLIHNVDAMMLITGVCDKNPATLYDVAARQECDAETSTNRMLNSYLKYSLLQDAFFNTANFVRPFNAGSSESINQQSFFMTLIQHISMCSESSNTADAHALIRFIDLCRKERFSHLDHIAFITWFTDSCRELGVADLMDSVFFNNIEKEILFCKSQNSGLVFVATKLASMRFSPRSLAGAAAGPFQPLINPEVPFRDMDNLKALKKLYLSLSLDQKEVLVHELLLAVIMQAGEMQAERLGLAADQDFSLFPRARNCRNRQLVMSSIENNKTTSSRPQSPVKQTVTPRALS